MERKKILIILILILLFILLAFTIYFYTSTGNSNGSSNGKIGVVVTVGPQEEFVKRVGGDRVNVTVMVPPGADPHTYEPLPSQMKQVQDAQIYFQVGSGIEFELTWMDKLTSMNSQMKVVNSSAGIQLIPNTAEAEEGSDPHVWVSPRNAKIMVENIYQALVQEDPQNKDYYTKNRDEYLKELDDLDKNITQTMSGKNNTKIMVYHPAWAYFCKDYNLQQVAIEQAGKEPTPQNIAFLVDTARNESIKVIFVSPEFSTSNAQVIANEIGGKVVVVDPLSRDYLENMKNVAEAFAAT
ncbi:metal ABC transporter solute-binding protein, Zn/Mn family [Methanobacterium formicicum]|uniref:Heavy metal ABC transporter substrate-binding protein n=1 Tax=Methanobacterium formicicum (strain DSM 3637 / PP1) TaxID=1204725 RepID=K2R1Q0_METFP|nr:zinc ABC transporter substrate-binding protein [Methanobacterium formicicum]EKF86443.1 heavy metal ABC transporter substrate-binding protein [Methanobacterium formicicum DSM 3637]